MSPSRSLKSGGRVAAIKMEDSGIHYGFPLKLPGRIGQTRVAMPQNRSLPDAFFQKNDGDLTGSAVNLAYAKFESFCSQACQLRFTSFVGANRSDIARSQTEPS